MACPTLSRHRSLPPLQRGNPASNFVFPLGRVHRPQRRRIQQTLPYPALHLPHLKSRNDSRPPRPPLSLPQTIPRYFTRPQAPSGRIAVPNAALAKQMLRMLSDRLTSISASRPLDTWMSTMIHCPTSLLLPQHRLQNQAQRRQRAPCPRFAIQSQHLPLTR
jgi:hypothetical protein